MLISVIEWPTATVLAEDLEMDEKLLFHLLDLTILRAYVLSKSRGSTLTHLKFREQLVRDLIVLTQKENTDALVTPRGRTSFSESQLSCLEVKHSTHWPEKGKSIDVGSVS
jgi:hypothetical protein